MSGARRTGDLRLLALALPFYCAFLAVYIMAPEDPDYAVSLTAQTARSVYLGILFGIAAAVRASDLRSGGVSRPGGIRRPVTLLGALWPLLVFAVVAQCAFVGVVAVVRGAGVTAPILAVSLVVLLAQIVFAGWVGLMLSGTRAAIVLVVFWGLWFVPRLGPFDGCCAGNETWSRPAAGASLAVGVALLVGTLAAVALAGRPAWSVIVAVTVPFAVAAVTALLLPDVVRGAAAQPRPDDTRCFDGDVRICLRPEHVDELAEVGAVVAEMNRAWRPYGVTMPATVSEAGGPGRVQFQYGPEHSADLVRLTLAVNMTPSPDACFRKPLPPEHDRALVAAVDHVTTWLLLTGGEPRWSAAEELREVLTDPANLDAVDDVTDRPEAEQAAWYETQLATIESCGGRDV
ncbi:hypothetical protein [Cryptosporangium sp. NPDC048952]|uniref:DUF7224 domain-containing protein n=1 Tax=Cryptosporangium sp. NPDC048952 TaxID=3363961 RepID=UPI00371FA6D3